MKIPFFPERWITAWVLDTRKEEIRAAIQEKFNTAFLRKIECLYPKLEEHGIRMLKTRPFVDSDRWRNYHVGLLTDLDTQIYQIDSGVYLDLERWNATAARREEVRDVLIYPPSDSS